jgi:hypothetical protein
MGYIRDSYRLLTRKPLGKRTFERMRKRKEDNIRMDLGEFLFIVYLLTLSVAQIA